VYFIDLLIYLISKHFLIEFYQIRFSYTASIHFRLIYYLIPHNFIFMIDLTFIYFRKKFVF